MSDPRPDAGPISPAQAMYGPNGPISGPDPEAAFSITSGIAKPAAETPGNALFTGNQPRPPTSPSGPTPAAPFNPERYAAPEGGHLDSALMGEFSTGARKRGIDQQGGEWLLDMHHKAIAARDARHEQARADWQATTERDFGDRLPRVVDDIQTAVGDDADAKRFYQMLEWSGLAVEPAVLRVLHRLARRY